MSQTGTSAWWADVQYLRDAAERTDEARRRADRAELAARRASRDRRRVEAETVPAPQRRRLEPDTPAPRRRDHVEAQRRDGYADPAAGQAHGAADAALRNGYADAAARHPYGAADAALRHGAYSDAGAPSGRRTIEIRGRPVPAPAVPRTLDADRRRPPRRAVERVGPRPDRLALWALVMGLVLILVAVTTADAATVATVAGF